jgi:hypothetical protein
VKSPTAERSMLKESQVAARQLHKRGGEGRLSHEDQQAARYVVGTVSMRSIRNDATSVLQQPGIIGQSQQMGERGGSGQRRAAAAGSSRYL